MSAAGEPTQYVQMLAEGAWIHGDLATPLTSSWELSREYRFTDADGTRPDWGEHVKDIEWPDWLTESVEPTIRRLETMTERMRMYLPKGTQARP